MNHKHYRTLEKDLVVILEKSRKRSSLSIQDILDILSEKGRPLILIVLSLLFCQPIQIPGLSTPFGLVIAIIGLQMVWGKKIWLPKSIASKTVSSTTIQNIVQKSIRIRKKLGRLIRPRWNWMCRQRTMQVLNGLLLCLLGIILALPLPLPLSNLTAGWSILLVAFGLLEEDGIFVLAGYLASLLTLAFFVSILFSLEMFF